MQLYLIKALPFGAVSSVSGFLRASSAIQLILCRLLAVPMTIYFDDLSLMATDSDAEHIDYIVMSVLQLLGWKTSSNPKEQHQFGKVFSMLGVSIDVSSTLDGYIKISNKPSRVQDVRRAIEGFLRDGKMTSQEAASLKGKLSYMDAQHFARLGIPTTKSLDRRARAHSSSTKFGDELRESLRWALFLLHHGPPRVVRLSRFQDQVVTFTDGAVEGVDHRECSMGAVAFFPHRGLEYFSATIPMKIVDLWKSERREHVIYQSQMLPVVLAIEMWQEDLGKCPGIFMIDNEAVRHSLVASQSRLSKGMKMKWHSLGLIARRAMRPWYARVPSQCNIADAPSRSNTSEVERRGTRGIDIPNLNAWYQMLARPSKT